MEVALLLTAGQVDALSRVSARRGLTAGQLVRQAITEFLLGVRAVPNLLNDRNGMEAIRDEHSPSYQVCRGT
jgi:hypothetical protein